MQICINMLLYAWILLYSVLQRLAVHAKVLWNVVQTLCLGNCSKQKKRKVMRRPICSLHSGQGFCRVIKTMLGAWMFFLNPFLCCISVRLWCYLAHGCLRPKCIWPKVRFHTDASRGTHLDVAILSGKLTKLPWPQQDCATCHKNICMLHTHIFNYSSVIYTSLSARIIELAFCWTIMFSVQDRNRKLILELPVVLSSQFVTFCSRLIQSTSRTRY